VHRQSLSSSPDKRKYDTPEWKRRLIYGELAYGEQRDLFTSAGTGLEGMFKPPVQVKAHLDDDRSNLLRNNTTLPSSPPEIAGNYSNYDVFSDRSSEQELPEQIGANQTKGRSVRYRLADEGGSDTSGLSDMSVRRKVPHQEVQAGSSRSGAQFLAPATASDEPRKASSQSAARHEDFSPIFIGRRGGEDGKNDFSALDLSPSVLYDRLERLQKDRLRASGSEHGHSSAAGGRSQGTAGTGGVQRLGSYVNLRRGDQSADGSFQHRVLTPALGNTSDMLPEESLQASTPKQFPSLRGHKPNSQDMSSATPQMPAVPFPSPTKKQFRMQDSGGSPLKLFGPYDTFTNQTLLRRISQFEDPNTSPTSEKPPYLGKRNSLGSASKKTTDADVKPQSTEEDPEQSSRHDQRQTRSVSQFGAGELDGFEFDEDFSRLSNDSDDEFHLHRSVTFDGTVDSSPPGAANISITKRRQKPDNASAVYFRTLSGAASRTASALLAATPKHQIQDHEYKRPRTSPTKDPTPKRRRTLHESDISFGAEDEHMLESTQSSHQHMQVVVGKKRKDAHADKIQQKANPEVLASRKVLRVRTPTPSPSQRSLAQKEQHSYDQLQVPGSDGARRTRKGNKKAQHPSNFPGGGGRKPSIRTEDFINEAHRIMAAIRGKNGTRSGLTSVEESESENTKQSIRESALPDSSFQESTREPFSRPPSRDGKPIPRTINRQQNPDLVNHLKKYEEHSDMGDIIASSLRSLGVSKEDIRAVQALEYRSHSSMSEASEQSVLRHDEIVSDPPNIRISENPHRYEHTTSAEQAQQFRDRLPSHSSGSESGISTGQSTRTGSSRGSDTRRTIAPQSVSHLIPDQVGNMVLDRQRNVWVKSNKVHTTRMKRSSTLVSENSEDDPFADIPDLTVDATRELQNLRDKQSRQAGSGKQFFDPEKFVGSPQQSVRGPSLKSILVRDFAEKPSKNASMRSTSRLMRKFAEADNEDVEHEITLHEDRLDDSSPRRRMTISFSSPIASIIQDVVSGGGPEETNTSMFEQSVADILQSTGRRNRRATPHHSLKGHGGSRPRSTSSAPLRHMSVRGAPFVPRPVSVIDEDSDEKSFAERTGVSKAGGQSFGEEKPTQSRQASVSIMFKTPGRPKSKPRPDNAETLSQQIGNLSLSPMSDFTAHQDRSYAFEVSYLVEDQNLVTGDTSRKRMSQTVRHLVSKIAEVEPFEPYWEDLKEMTLREKDLGSLHMLDRFCGSLIKLDASQNTIRALDGIPASTRELTITHNLLSELTAWDRLGNLQYVNVSNNEIKSLSAFNSLVHLRGLVADNCGLANLDGVRFHDSLQTLRARGNAIERLNFDGANLQRLTSLDLESNEIREIESLHELSSLTYLNLKGNQLVKFSSAEPLALKHLIVSDNKLRKVDVASIPRLHLLYADRNKLTTVAGLSRVPHLDSLSLREQGGPKPFDVSFLETAYEVRKLFLSGNHLGFFDPPRDFLNLQLLDLANCGLQRLPDNIGHLMPNLRVANLCFNGLSDVSGLTGIPRLKRLLLAGNRLANMKSLLGVLSQFPWLTEVDLRDNLITLGFYPPMRVVVRDGEAQNTDIFKLPDADAERDARYCGRLDMETRIQRRVYERKCVQSCKHLQKLDGLPADKKIRQIRDVVWKNMVLRGMLLQADGLPFDLSQYELEGGEDATSYVSDGESEAEKGKAKCAVDESERWGIEDSFAG
jgi:protein NUD1